MQVRRGSRLGRTTVRGFLIILACWSAFAVISTLEARIDGMYSRKPEPWGALVLNQLEWTTTWALFTPVIFGIAKRFRLDSKPYWRNGLVHLLAAVAISVATRAAWVSVMGLTSA